MKISHQYSVFLCSILTQKNILAPQVDGLELLYEYSIPNIDYDDPPLQMFLAYLSKMIESLVAQIIAVLTYLNHSQRGCVKKTAEGSHFRVGQNKKYSKSYNPLLAESEVF